MRTLKPSLLFSLPLLSSLILSSIPVGAITPLSTSSSMLTGTEVSIGFPPSPNRGTVNGGTVGGGHRGQSCLTNNSLPMTAIIPPDYVITTENQKVNLIWYSPENQTKTTEIVVWNENGEYVYNAEYDSPKESGLVQATVDLSKDEAFQNSNGNNNTASTTVRQYYWEVALVCDPEDRSNDVYVWGTIEYRPNNNKTPLPQLVLNSPAPTPTQVNTLYQEAVTASEKRLWNESISRLAIIRQEKPQEWEQFLNSVGIEDPQIIGADFIATLKTPNQSNNQ